MFLDYYVKKKTHFRFVVSFEQNTKHFFICNWLNSWVGSFCHIGIIVKVAQEYFKYSGSFPVYFYIQYVGQDLGFSVGLEDILDKHFFKCYALLIKMVKDRVALYFLQISQGQIMFSMLDWDGLKSKKM